MYQYALVKMLRNTKTNRWHPIYYYDSPFAGPIEEQSVMRYKSKGHHTLGFDERNEAVKSAEDLISKLKEQNDTVLIEINEDEDLIWDDDEIPTDIQIRGLPKSLQK